VGVIAGISSVTSRALGEGDRDRAQRRGNLGIVLAGLFGLAVGVALSLLLIINLGYWEETVETLSLVIYATFFCTVIGVPLGIAAAHRPWLYTTMRPVLDLMQTIPTFAYLIPTLIIFGLGVVPGLISMVVIAALVGADGLGKPVVRALNTVNVAQGFEAGLSIVIVAILLDRLCKQREAKQKGR